MIKIKGYNKKTQLKHELSELSLQKYAVNEFFSSRSQVIRALVSLRTHGIIEDRLLKLNNFLGNNKYKASS